MQASSSSAAGIGDIASTARGSGARFNTGKPAVELIPTWIIAQWAEEKDDRTPAQDEAVRVLYALGVWQSGNMPAVELLAEMDSWVVDCARVFEYGRAKYAAWNWAKGMPWSVPLACAVRHCLAILEGEENDPESGLPHRGHIACNLVMLAQFEDTYREGDDRPDALTGLTPASDAS